MTTHRKDNRVALENDAPRVDVIAEDPLLLPAANDVAQGFEHRPDQRHDRAASGSSTVLRGAVRIKVGGDQLRSIDDHLHGVLEHFKR